MRILIIGALGNLGSLAAAKLAHEHPDISLRLTSHRVEGVAELQRRFPKAEVMKADWNDPASLTQAVQSVDRILIIMTDFVVDEAVATPNIIRALEQAGRIELVLRFIALPPGLDRQRIDPELLATRAGAMLTLTAKPLLDKSSLPVCYVNASCWIGFNIGWFYAEDIRAHSQICMPASSDMPRQWVAEQDICDAFVKILTTDPALHGRKEYLVAGGERYSYAEQAALIGSVLGRNIRWVDTDASLRRLMGDKFDKLIRYFAHEIDAYRSVPQTRNLEDLLGRPRLTLRSYVESIRESLI
jgi:uncharacterized protein YbjT (DUF2867 family)